MKRVEVVWCCGPDIRVGCLLVVFFVCRWFFTMNFFGFEVRCLDCFDCILELWLGIQFRLGGFRVFCPDFLFVTYPCDFVWGYEI